MQSAYFQTLQVAEQLLIRIETATQLRCDFALGRRMTQPRGKGSDRLLHRPPFAPKLSRTPVQSAKTVQNRSTDAELCIASELVLLVRVELCEGIHQPYQSRREQVIHLYV